MLRTLKAEGFEVSDRGMMRVRSKNGWLLRVPNGGKSYGAGEMPIKRKLNRFQENDGAQQGQKGQNPSSLQAAFAVGDIAYLHEKLYLLQDSIRANKLTAEM